MTTSSATWTPPSASAVNTWPWVTTESPKRTSRSTRVSAPSRSTRAGPGCGSGSPCPAHSPARPAMRSLSVGARYSDRRRRRGQGGMDEVAISIELDGRISGLGHGDGRRFVGERDLVPADLGAGRRPRLVSSGLEVEGQPALAGRRSADSLQPSSAASPLWPGPSGRQLQLTGGRSPGRHRPAPSGRTASPGPGNAACWSRRSCRCRRRPRSHAPRR